MRGFPGRVSRVTALETWFPRLYRVRGFPGRVSRVTAQKTLVLPKNAHGNQAENSILVGTPPLAGFPAFYPPKKTGTFHLVSFRFVQVTGF
ncbi:hypothetical protein HMPREF0578_0002 [Mobiluncus mulieris 28-1]|nr:hypothetical protein HMPREF0578_0002 [Mobiluncus mulieris 28-1]